MIIAAPKLVTFFQLPNKKSRKNMQKKGVSLIKWRSCAILVAVYSMSRLLLMEYHDFFPACKAGKIVDVVAKKKNEKRNHKD